MGWGGVAGCSLTVAMPKGPIEVTKPYRFIGFGAMDVTKPYKFIGFLGSKRTSPSPKTHGRKWGAKPPTCDRGFLGRETAASTPKIYDFDFLKYSMRNVRTVNRPSGPDCGRTATGKHRP